MTVVVTPKKVSLLLIAVVGSIFFLLCNHEEIQEKSDDKSV